MDFEDGTLLPYSELFATPDANITDIDFDIRVPDCGLVDSNFTTIFNVSVPAAVNSTADAGGCAASWDFVSCWKARASNTTAVVPCFSELANIRYDPRGKEIIYKK